MLKTEDFFELASSNTSLLRVTMTMDQTQLSLGFSDWYTGWGLLWIVPLSFLVFFFFFCDTGA
jgi:hypothetical protein